MTTLHEAAQQALDGAKWINDEQAIVPSHLLVALRAALAQEAEPTVKDSLQVMRQALRNAEWQDKHIHPIGAESFQNWLLKIYLPVPLSATDKSPEAALRAALAQEEPEPVEVPPPPKLTYTGGWWAITGARLIVETHHPVGYTTHRELCNAERQKWADWFCALKDTQ